MPQFSLHYRSKSGISLVSLEIGIVVHRPIKMPSLVQGVVGNNDLVLWWSQFASSVIHIRI